MKAQHTEIAGGPVSVTGSCGVFKPCSWGEGGTFQDSFSPRGADLQNDKHSSQRAQPIVLPCCVALVACRVLQGKEELSDDCGMELLNGSALKRIPSFPWLHLCRGPGCSWRGLQWGTSARMPWGRSRTFHHQSPALDTTVGTWWFSPQENS